MKEHDKYKRCPCSQHTRLFCSFPAPEPMPTQNGFLLRRCDNVSPRSTLLVCLIKRNLNKISNEWSRSWPNRPVPACEYSLYKVPTHTFTHFSLTWLSHVQPREPSRIDKCPPSLANGRRGRKEINHKPGVFSLPPGTLASSLRHRKHSAGWISVTKLWRGEALRQPGRDKAAYPQGRSSAALGATGSFLPVAGCEFHLCEKITLILWA